MSTATRVIKNTGYLYAKMGITMFISLYTTRLILNSLGASDFGIFNIVGGAINMLGFLNAAMAGATQRFISIAQGEQDLEKQKKVFNVGFTLHFGLSIIVGLSLIIIGIFFFQGILNIPSNRIFAAQIIYGSLIVSTIFTIMTAPYDAVMNAHENMKYYAIIGILEALLKLSIAIIVVYTTSDKLIIYGILMAFIPIVTLSIMCIYCNRNYSECIISPQKYWNNSILKGMSVYAGWSFIDAMTSIVASNGLSIILNHFWGTILNAAQGIANQVGGQLTLFSQNMMKALTPVIMKNEGAGNRNFMLKIAVLGCKYSFALLAFFAIPFIIETPYILKLWLKNVPEWAILFCRLQLIRSMFEQMTINLWSAIAAQGNIKRFYACKSILNFSPLLLCAIGFNYGLPPYWLYIFWIICWGILNGLVIIYFAKKQCQLSIKEYMNVVIKPSIVFSLLVSSFGIIPSIFLSESFTRLIITIIICATIFIFTFWISSNKNEKIAITNILIRIFSKIHK